MLVGSDVDYEDLLAEVSYKNHILCSISQEEGYECLEIEINLGEGIGRVVVPLKGFEEAIQHAKKRLWDLRKVEEE